MLSLAKLRKSFGHIVNLDNLSTLTFRVIVKIKWTLI